LRFHRRPLGILGKSCFLAGTISVANPIVTPIREEGKESAALMEAPARNIPVARLSGRKNDNRSLGTKTERHGRRRAIKLTDSNEAESGAASFHCIDYFGKLS